MAQTEQEQKKEKTFSLQKFPFREGMDCVKVIHLASKKFCNFMVKRTHDGWEFDLRSPTPVFSKPDEMTEAEIRPLLPAMHEALMDEYK